MGKSQSKLGSVSLILPNHPLVPGGVLQGALRLRLRPEAQVKRLEVVVQSRELTSWTEERRVLNPLRGRYERINVDVGTHKDSVLVESEQFLDLHPSPAEFSTLPFSLYLPSALRPAFEAGHAGADCSFSYQLRVQATDSAGKFCCLFPLPSAKVEHEEKDTYDEGLVYDRKAHSGEVNFNPLIGQSGKLNLVLAVRNRTVKTGDELKIHCDFDNSGNPHALVSAQFALVREYSLIGDAGRKTEFEITELTHDLEGLPLAAGSSIQRKGTEIPIPPRLPPTFSGDLITNRYTLRLNVSSASLLQLGKTVALGEVSIVSEHTETGNDVVETDRDLVLDAGESRITKWVSRAEWTPFLVNTLTGAALRLIQFLLTKK